MAEPISSSVPEGPPLWRFIRLEHYLKPSEPARETVRRGWRGFWERLRRTQPSTPLMAQIDLGLVPDEFLDQAAPAPSWQEAVPALDEVLPNRWKGFQDAGVRVVVGAPWSGTPEMVAYWAETHSFYLVEAPASEVLLSGAGEWQKPLENYDHVPWVIPRLDHWYLRHSHGLRPLRQLLEKICTRSQPTLLACNTWAWAYLSKALQIHALLPAPLILEAFDQERLERWFLALAHDAAGPGLVFRQADTGKFVLPPPEDMPTLPGQEPSPSTPDPETARPGKTSDFLSRLAAYSRGIPGVAWRLWRHSLRFARHEEEDHQAQAAATPDYHRTIWVKPWTQLDLPAIPGTDQGNLLILHGLLLHNGLPGHLLPQLLPLPESQIWNHLQILQNAGVVEMNQDIWRITALGYPAVRDALFREGYLVDAV